MPLLTGSILLKCRAFYQKCIPSRQVVSHGSGLARVTTIADIVLFCFQKVLTEFSGLFFVPLASRLVNDESPHCKKLAALAVKVLLNRVSLRI